jgi:hypothetical protein
MLTEPAENAEWAGLSTAIFPLVASAGTVIFSWVSLTTCVLASCPLPIHALSTPVNPLPVTVTTPPLATLDGEKLDMVGCGYVVAKTLDAKQTAAMEKKKRREGRTRVLIE